MTDRRSVTRLEQVLRDAGSPVEIASWDLTDGARFRNDEIVHEEGQLLLPVRRAQIVLSCPAQIPGAKEQLQLAAAMARSLQQPVPREGTPQEVYRRALQGQAYGTELETLARDMSLPLELERCVMTFHVAQVGDGRAWDVLEGLVPMEDRDVLVDMDRHTVVLIKDTSDGSGTEELLQFAGALQETLLNEKAQQLTVGIGSGTRQLSELHRSYAEARRAIEVGRRFRPGATAHAYDDLLLERLLLELSGDVAARYSAMLLRRRNGRPFDEELLGTVDMFFRKDLNLSDTARQLYIHRNTLVYRLEKIRQETGFDLRSFKDAVTFKLLMELGRCGGDDPAGHDH